MPASKTVIIRVPQSNRQQKPRSQQQKRRVDAIQRSRSNPFQRSLFAGYCKSLADPWEYPPVELGFYTMVPTVLGTAYLRGSFTVNADGSFGLVMSPSSTSMVSYNNAGAGVATWLAVNASNYTALSAQMTSARVVSGGIRAIALFPQTATPGVLVSGIISGINPTSVSTQTPNGLNALSDAELGFAAKGARAVILPQDVSAFQMSIAPLSGYGSTTYFPSALPYISGTGFPAGTTIWYESILNLEGLPAQGPAGVGTDESQLPSTPSLSDTMPNPESLVKKAVRLIGRPVIMDAALGLADMVLPGLGRFARSLFGGGSHASRSKLIAGQQVAQQARESSLLIEEVKEDEDYALAPARRSVLPARR